MLYFDKNKCGALPHVFFKIIIFIIFFKPDGLSASTSENKIFTSFYEKSLVVASPLNVVQRELEFEEKFFLWCSEKRIRAFFS